MVGLVVLLCVSVAPSALVYFRLAELVGYLLPYFVFLLVPGLVVSMVVFVSVV